MKYIQERLIQPKESTILIRYMDEWKYKSMCDNGLWFSSLDSQEDKNDGKSRINDGLGRLMNNTDFSLEKEYSTYKQNNFISCWAMDNKIITKKFDKYCFKNQSINAKYAYAILIKYEDIIRCIENECKYHLGNYTYLDDYINWGLVDYNGIYLTDEKAYRELHTFFKDPDYIEENEFRIKLTKASFYLKFKNNNYIYNNKPILGMNFCDGFIGYVYKVYKYNKENGTKEKVNIDLLKSNNRPYKCNIGPFKPTRSY